MSCWKRAKQIKNNNQEMREHLIGGGGGSEQKKQQLNVPRGCVAVLVGDEGGGSGDDTAAERFVVSVRALSQPCMQELLDMAAQEFGYDQKGVLRIPCTVERFRRAVATAGAQHR